MNEPRDVRRMQGGFVAVRMGERVKYAWPHTDRIVPTWRVLTDERWKAETPTPASQNEAP